MTLADYRQLVKIGRCQNCGAELPQEIEHYDHKYGWPVAGCDELQWLYLECPNCDAQWALWKLGVPRYEQAAS